MVAINKTKKAKPLSPGKADASDRLKALKARAKVMTTGQLKALFARTVRLHRDNLLTLGTTLIELEFRGAKVEGDADIFTPAFMGLLRRIGRGDVLPDVIVRYGNKPYVLKLAALPVAEQRQVLDQPKAEVDAAYRTAANGKPVADPPAAAERCLSLVRTCGDPAQAARLLIPQLEQIMAAGTAKGRRKQLA